MGEHSLIVCYVEGERELFCVILDGKSNLRKNFWNRMKTLLCLVKYWLPHHGHVQVESVCLEILQSRLILREKFGADNFCVT